jgi:hypothetical protein
MIVPLIMGPKTGASVHRSPSLRAVLLPNHYNSKIDIKPGPKPYYGHSSSRPISIPEAQESRSVNKSVKASIAAMMVAAGLLVSQLVGLRPALAVNPPCPSFRTSAPFWLWTRSDVAVFGIRAPVQMRTNGLLCLPVSDLPFAAAWIGIQQEVGNGITQIGFVHHYNSSGVGVYCRFWAIGTGSPHFYDCGGTPNGKYVFFKIKRYYDTPTRTYRYAVDDCGEAGGYGSCTVKSGSQAAYGNPEGIVAAETNYGCTIRIMGSGSAPTHYGTSSYPVQGYVTTWATRTWSSKQTEGDCTSYYGGKKVTGGMVTWDTRN